MPLKSDASDVGKSAVSLKSDASDVGKSGVGNVELTTRLQELLAARKLSPKLRIEARVKDASERVKKQIGSDCKLHTYERYTVVTSDEIPDGVARILQDMDEGLLWALLNRDLLRSATLDLQEIGAVRSLLVGYDGFASTGVHKADFIDVSKVLGRLRDTTAAHCTGILERIIASGLTPSGPRSVLGSYHFKTNTVKVYWVVVWLIAHELAVEPEDLAEVVLAHEVAHAFTHLGGDADKQIWETDKFQRCERMLMEGLAQFYTCLYVGGSAAKISGKSRQSGARSGLAIAFDQLLVRLPEQYKTFVSWPVPARGSLEAVRAAMLSMRQYEQAKHIQFVEKLRNLAGVAE
jgi:hypothetical protein